MKRLACALGAILCAAAMAEPAAAEQVLDTRVLEAAAESPLTGLCITWLPENGRLMLGDRQLRPGDVLTAEQAAAMTFASNGLEEEAEIRYLPVFADGLAEETSMFFSLRGKENKPPVAEDFAIETYKNLEVSGNLRVHDPEGEAMTFTMTREPRRGSVVIQEDGSFVYTPKKNKVGIDSFAYTASDAAGKTSRETTVTVTILKPTDAKQYCDTAGKSCRFAAEWMRHTGIFVGESVGDDPCFAPDKAQTRGEFLAMLVKTLNLPTDQTVTLTGFEDAPNWLKPYLAAAARSGLLASLPERETFNADDPVTAEEAAAMLCAALHLDLVQQPTLAAETEYDAITIANDNGFNLTQGQLLTRGDTAQLLYQAAQKGKG